MHITTFFKNYRATATLAQAALKNSSKSSCIYDTFRFFGCAKTAFSLFFALSEQRSLRCAEILSLMSSKT
jgi:hypothetical protein